MTNDTIRVLVLDDNRDDIAALRRMLHSETSAVHVIAASTADECARKLRREGADLMLVDYRMPGEDGLAVLRRLSASFVLPPAIVITGQGDERVAVEAIRSGAFDYLRKDGLSGDVLARTLRAALERFRAHEAEAELDERIVFALAAAISEKDATTGGHLQRMALHALVLGQALGLNDYELSTLKFGAMLHDIGKLAVRDGVLMKPGALDEDEWEEIRLHPVIGDRMCRCLRLPGDVRAIIRHHHERWDGSGYVGGLARDAIPRLARVVSVVDAFDAMSSDRPYRRALPPDEVVRRLEAGAGSQWDPVVTRVLLDLLAWGGLEPGLANGNGTRQ